MGYAHDHDPEKHTGHFPSVDPLAADVFGAFMRAMHAHRQLMGRRMAMHGMHPAQMFCLSEIAHHDGITQRDLAEHLNVSRPTLTVMLQKMEKAGLVERRSDEHDQRYTRLTLTEQGEAVHDEMHDIIVSIIQDMKRDMSDEDLAQFAGLLKRLGENLQTAAIGQETTE